MQPIRTDGSSFPGGGSEAARIISNFDWSRTSLGPIETWSPTLRSVCSLILESPVPIVTLWNEDGVMIYNDAYSIFAGGRHPTLFGSKVREGWPEVADFNDNVMKVGLAGGTLAYRDQQLSLNRSGTPEPAWMDLDYSPIRDESGTPVGVMAIVVETTQKVRAERRLREEKIRLQKMFEQAPGFVATLTGPDNRVEIANDAYLQLVGHRPIVGQPLAEALPEVVGQGFIKLLDEVRATGTSYIGRQQLVKLQRQPDAELQDRYLDFIYQPVFDADGTVGSIFVQGYDVTEQKLAEEAARESESRFRLVSENAPVMLWKSDPAGRCLYLNAALRQFWNVEEDAVQAFDWDGLVHPQDAPGLARAVAEALMQRQPYSADARYRNGQGQYRLLHIEARPRFGARGEFLGMVGVNSDITDVRNIEIRRLALIELNDRLREILEPDDLAHAAVEILAKALGVSRAGYGVIDPIGETVTVKHDWTAPGVVSLAGTHRFRDYGNFIEDLRRNEPVVFSDAHLDPRTAGSASALKAIGVFAAVIVPLAEEDRIAALLFVNESTAREWTAEEIDFIREFGERTRTAVERRRAEQALQELATSLERKVAERSAELDRVWRNSRDILAVMRPDGQIRAINPAWSSVLGHRRKEVIGHSLSDFLPQEDVSETVGRLEEAFAIGMMTDLEMRLRHKDSGFRTISWRLAFEGELIFAYGRDVTAQKEQAEALRQAEDLIRQTQKMEAIGQLTGGVAHDFNNLLQVVAGNLYLLSKDVAGNPRAERRIEHALAGVNRGSKLASQLLAFGRRQPLEPKSVNIGGFVANMDDMLRRAIGEAVEVRTERMDGVWNTFVDPVQMENALLNLAINARDAMQGSGMLTVSVANVTFDEGEAQRHGQCLPGDYVALSVADTGAGMPPDIIDKVFEPFFSTKPVGKGTGLGLSMVYGFVKQSGGHVKIDSTLGEGTTVTIYLPRSRQEEDRLEEEPTGAVGGGSETILVAEDDEQVRSTVVEMLSDLGYTILKARDAASALALVEDGAKIDLLFTDVVMPGPLKSAELARLVRQHLPEVAVLFTSGYTENSIVHGGRLDPGVDLLSKPYSRDALARKIRHVLNNQRQRNLNRQAEAKSQPQAPTDNLKAQALNILYVEDDAFIRMDTVDLLQTAGHKVVEAGSGEDALRLISTARPQDFDVLLTDVGLPGISGAELARKAHDAAPQLPVIFVTGSVSVPGFENDPRAATLVKPYSERSLLKALDESRGIGAKSPLQDLQDRPA